METLPNGRKRLALATDAIAVAQRITVRLRTFEGESLYHPEMGLPKDVVIGGFDAGLIEAAVINEVKKEPAVESVDNVQVFFGPQQRTNRTVNINVGITLVDGDTIDVSTDLRA